MKMEIRFAKENDYLEILPIALQVHKLHTDHRNDIYKENSNPLDLEDYKIMLNTPDKYRAIVALSEENNLVGYAIVQIQNIKDHKVMNDAKVYVIDSIAIDDKFKRNGIGKTIIDWIKKEAINDNADRIVLNVLNFNKDAIAFYKKIGMKEQAIKYEIIL